MILLKGIEDNPACLAKDGRAKGSGWPAVKWLEKDQSINRCSKLTAQMLS